MIHDPSSTSAASEADSWTVLMTAAQRGDRVAYARLLQEIRPRIRSIASRSLRDRRDVEDVIQDVLMTVHTVRATYDPTRPFSPWLTGIIKHRIAKRSDTRTVQKSSTARSHSLTENLSMFCDFPPKPLETFKTS